MIYVTFDITEQSERCCDIKYITVITRTLTGAWRKLY